ncbi:MAG: response regulator [Fibrobacteria bacterium]|nr:response regulator [Fibrobacteria bacterium]
MNKPNKINVLMVDDDTDFCFIFKKLSGEFSIDLEIVHRVVQAKQLLRERNYDVVILDGYLPDGSGIDLSQWILERLPIKPITAFISSGYSDAKSYNLLKETHKIDYILNKPLDNQDLKNFFTNISRTTSQIKASEIQDTPFLNDLRKEYVKTLYNKLSKLEKLITRLQSTPNPDTIRSLKDDIHLLAGSAGSYGFHDVSRIARELESRLKLFSESGKLIPQPWLDSLTGYYLKIKNAFQIDSDEEHVNTTLSKDREPGITTTQSQKDWGTQNYQVLIIDDDSTLINNLSEVGEKAGITIRCESNIETAVNLVSNPDTKPDIMIVDKNFPDSSVTGFELIKLFRNSHALENHTMMALTSSDRSMENRIEAVRYGIDLFIEKPFSFNKVVEDLKIALDNEDKKKFQIILVDGDRSLGGLLKEMLKGIPADIQHLYNGNNLMEELENFVPDLVLLDLHLPGFSGMVLLESIKTDYRYKDIPLIVITFENNPDVIETTYLKGADDFLVKPISNELIRAKISNEIKKQKQLHFYVKHDSLTGLYNRRSFNELFEVSFSRCHRERKNLTLAILDLDLFKSINDRFGHNAGDSVLIQFGQTLRSSFRQSDISFRWGGEEFLVLFEGLPAVRAKFVLASLMEYIRNNIEVPGHPDVEISFSGGVSSYPTDDSTMDGLVTMADIALYAAKESGRGRIFSADKTANLQEGNFKKETVLLLNNDNNITDMLYSAFEIRGYNVVTEQTIRAALEYIGKSKKDLLKLIIVDCEISENIGPDFCHKLQEIIFPCPSTLFLTNQEIENYSCPDFKNSLTDSIPKPFSLSLLLDKALGLL